MTNNAQKLLTDKRREAQARQAILDNGYRLIDRLRSVEAFVPGQRKRGRAWFGVNCLDLVQSYGLDKRRAKRKPQDRCVIHGDGCSFTGRNCRQVED